MPFWACPFGHALSGMPFWACPFGHALSGMPLRGMPLRGAPLRGALGRAPPPVCRAEILKKFRGKSVPENYTLFFEKHVFLLKTLWDLSRTTDLVEIIRMQFFYPKLIVER